MDIPKNVKLTDNKTILMSNTKAELIKDMLLALEANIEFLKSEGSSQIPLRNGRFLEEVAGLFLYEFGLEVWQNIELDTEIEIRVKGVASPGRVTGIDDNVIQITIDTFLGESISEAKLIVSSYYLLKILHDKLQEVSDGKRNLTELCDKTFGLVPSTTKTSTKNLSENLSENPLNDFQRTAVSLALGSDVSYIWGPPGTGKTQTIAKIIEEFLLENLSVLLISHTNVAVDEALIKALKHFEKVDKVSEYQNGKIIRIGSIKSLKQELPSEFPLVIPENIVISKTKPIRDEIEKIDITIKDITKESAGLLEIISKFEQLENTIKQLNSAKTQLQDHEVQISSYKKMLELLRLNLKENQIRTEKFMNSSTISKWLSGTNTDKLTRENADLMIKIEEASKSLESSIKRVANYESTITEYKHNIETLKESVANHDYPSLKTKINNLNENEKQQKTLRDSYIKQLEELSKTIIKDAKVIATTLTKCYSSELITDREYDCVIIDEASMAPLPSVWYSTGLAKKKVVIVGDLFQLPPVSKNEVLIERKTEEQINREKAAVTKWLINDIYSYTGIDTKIKQGLEVDQLQQLKIQYRMHPQIAEVVNELVYKKYSEKYGLESGEITHDRGNDMLSSEPLPDAHVGIYDTGLVKTVPTRLDTGSYYNLYQALLCVKLGEKALSSGYTRVGIISPFRAQTNFLIKILKDKGLEKKIAADTVHRFQGGEKQLIIFDVTTPEKTKMTDDSDEGGTDEKLINVAFSRAEEKCILVGDVEKIKSKHSDSSNLKRFIQICERESYPTINAQNIIHSFIGGEADDWLQRIYKVKNLNAIIEEANKSTIYAEDDFYKEFIKDLIKAEYEVIIDSPFVTTSRVEHLLPMFAYLIEKGVKIFVMTRSPKDHEGAMKEQAQRELKKLDELGCTVLVFKGHPHRKLSIIDRQILWEGSLNILSQSDSKEMMRRFEGTETANQVMKFLKLDKNIGPMGENKLKRCEQCKETGAYYWTDMSRFGLWTFCLVGSHKPGAKPKTEEELKEKKKKVTDIRKSVKDFSPEGIPICPVDKMLMVKKSGRFGDFYACPQYPKCKATYNIKVK